MKGPVLIALIALAFAAYLSAVIVSTTVHDYKHPPGPCSVLDNRRCTK